MFATKSKLVPIYCQNYFAPQEKLRAGPPSFLHGKMRTKLGTSTKTSFGTNIFAFVAVLQEQSNQRLPYHGNTNIEGACLPLRACVALVLILCVPLDVPPNTICLKVTTKDGVGIE